MAHEYSGMAGKESACVADGAVLSVTGTVQQGLPEFFCQLPDF